VVPVVVAAGGFKVSYFVMVFKGLIARRAFLTGAELIFELILI